jgi:hypothetical protein
MIAQATMGSDKAPRLRNNFEAIGGYTLVVSKVDKHLQDAQSQISRELYSGSRIEFQIEQSNNQRCPGGGRFGEFFSIKFYPAGIKLPDGASYEWGRFTAFCAALAKTNDPAAVQQMANRVLAGDPSLVGIRVNVVVEATQKPNPKDGGRPYTNAKFSPA